VGPDRNVLFFFVQQRPWLIAEVHCSSDITLSFRTFHCHDWMVCTWHLLHVSLFRKKSVITQKSNLWVLCRFRLKKLPKVTCFRKNIFTTNVRLLAVRRRWSHCSSDRNNYHAIVEQCHLPSYLLLELCNFSSRLTICRSHRYVVQVSVWSHIRYTNYLRLQQLSFPITVWISALYKVLILFFFFGYCMLNVRITLWDGIFVLWKLQIRSWNLPSSLPA